MQKNLFLINLTKTKKDTLFSPLLEEVFLFLKNEILSKNYDLNIVFVNQKKIKSLNKKYRDINKPTNILSFSLSKRHGELILCHDVIKKESEISKEKYNDFLIFLVIHGMLHLKGMTHSSIMEKAEKKYVKKYRSKYRHR